MQTKNESFTSRFFNLSKENILYSLNNERSIREMITLIDYARDPWNGGRDSSSNLKTT